MSKSHIGLLMGAMLGGLGSIPQPGQGAQRRSRRGRKGTIRYHDFAKTKARRAMAKRSKQINRRMGR